MIFLIADDNFFYRRLLETTLKDLGYSVESVQNGEHAWQRLQADDTLKIAILDWMMPGLDGPEICRRVRALARPEPTYMIVLTSKAGKENLIAALDAGADDYITKPFDRDELNARLRVGVRVVGMQTSQSVIFAFAQACEAKSPYTQGHSARVAHYALGLARKLGLPSNDLNALHRGALLHDIGKIGVPDTILNKEAGLTPEEYEIMKSHPVVGFDMVQRHQSCADLLPLIRWHHERLDGKGYPDGISGSEIPMLVRILSIADVFDALSSKRPYRPPLGLTHCRELMEQDANRGSLDYDLVSTFVPIAATLHASAWAQAENSSQPPSQPTNLLEPRKQPAFVADGLTPTPACS